MMKQRPIAVQLYSVRAALENEWTAVLQKIADMGYIGVEAAGFSFADSPQSVKNELDNLGLVVCSAHSPLPLGSDKKSVLEAAHTLQTKRLVAGSTGHDKFDTVESIKRQAELFNGAYEVCQTEGLQFGLHNHWWEFVTVNGRNAFDIFLDALNPNILFEIDAYWAQTAGEDVVALLTRLGERVPLLHVKDGPATIEADMVAVGNGTMDYQTIIPAASSAEWLIVELDRCATDMLTAVADSYTYLTDNNLARGHK